MVKYQDAQLDQIFGALADPSRRKVVMTLRAGEATVEELSRPLGLSTPGMMKHLAVLERSGLIVTEKRGRQRFCRLEAEQLSAAEQWMAEAKQFWGGTLSRLANHLKDDK